MRLSAFPIVAAALAGCGSPASPSVSVDEAAPVATAAALATVAAPVAATASQKEAAGSVAIPAASAGSTGLAGPPDPSVKLAPAVTARVANLWIQAPAGWALITDPELGWMLQSLDGRAKLFLDEVDAGSALVPPKDGHVPGYVLKGTALDAPQNTTLGKFDLPTEVVNGTAHVDGQAKAGKLEAFVIATGAKRDVHGIAVFRWNASPEQEKAMNASIRSIRRASDK